MKEVILKKQWFITLFLTLLLTSSAQAEKSLEELKKATEATEKAQVLPKSFKAAEKAQAYTLPGKKVDVSGAVEDIIANRSTSAQKHLEIMQQLKEIDETRQKASRFKMLDNLTISLTNSASFKTLTVAVMVELRSNLTGIESLYGDSKDAIRAKLQENLSGMDDKQLFTERDERTILTMVRDTINETDETDFIENLYYTTFELA